MSNGYATGKPNYDEMGPVLAEATRIQMPHLQESIAGLGALKTVVFRNVTSSGMDLYVATYEKGTLAWRISLGDDGKIVNAMAMPDF